MASCCTCANLLPPSSKPLEHQELECCGRVVCAPCIDRNPRFTKYCPYCPPTTHLEPPLYSPPSPTEPPPPYSSSSPDQQYMHTKNEPAPTTTPDIKPPLITAAAAESTCEEKNPTTTTHQPPTIIHHLHHPHDTLPSLSLRYNIPLPVLRSHNALPSDHLLAARRAITIPPGYASSSLSPDPVEDPAETERKTKIRRFMMSCKVPDYDLAVVYLEAAAWDADVAAARWVDDEVWERENPLKKGKGKGRDVAASGPFWRRRWGS